MRPRKRKGTRTSKRTRKAADKKKKHKRKQNANENNKNKNVIIIEDNTNNSIARVETDFLVQIGMIRGKNMRKFSPFFPHGFPHFYLAQ